MWLFPDLVPAGGKPKLANTGLASSQEEAQQAADEELRKIGYLPHNATGVADPLSKG